uniref:Uncharacterized protein n=1 Tax=Rhizophora mucronata TaxID=61149 RepID=A0A2P2QLP7_RHIMU
MQNTIISNRTGSHGENQLMRRKRLVLP